ncbi:MAG: hypothetical protein JWR89_607 [Tardiphaga sp.]|nr:hypothetical protein [Tardiphaga sp.]
MMKRMDIVRWDNVVLTSVAVRSARMPPIAFFLVILRALELT